MHDMVIRNGQIYDGSGSEPFVGDVAIDAGKITAVGVVEAAGREELDAQGHAVTTGFDDVFTRIAKCRRHYTEIGLGVEYVASSLRYDNAANTIKMGGYGIVNLTMDWPFAKGWTLLVRGNNVFDKNYQLAADYATGGATVFAGVRWQL